MRKLVVFGLLLIMGCSTDNVLSYEDQMKKDLKYIDKYLEENNITTIKDETGLRLKIDNAGSGVPMTIDARGLVVKYTGKFFNGAVFAQSTLNSAGLPEPFRGRTGELLPLKDMIEAWQITFTKYVAKGGKATIYVPSGLAYGHTGSGTIPPNANLIFEVELINFSY
ncbi:MAG: FKBP-type peptidyl-prolyl cis-trans isomerase [Cyclobacteriaceae bacterium]|nr:FKBP-type peptidyl-prolyl cis-trans isomerase [Cyclobacteriaceae bacterium]